jgi:predicted MFS family arabinose efflux permease
LGAVVLLCWLDAAAAQPAPAIERRPLLRELVTGMEYVRKSPDLRQILIMLILSGIANGLFMALLRPLVGEALHGGDSQYTQLVSFFGLGGLLGPVVGYYAGQRFGLGRTLLAAFVIEAILLSLLSNVQSMQLATVIMLFWGLNEFAVLPCYMSYVHLRTEPETMGRTFAVFGQAEYMPQVFAAALVGVVGSRLPVQQILAITSIAYLALLVLTLPSQGSRALRANRQLALALPQSAGSD